MRKKRAHRSSTRIPHPILHIIKIRAKAAILYHLYDSGFSLFPPLYYRFHSPRRIKRDTHRELAELKRMYREYKLKYQIK